MAFAGIKSPEDRADLLVYLRTLADEPVPLPEAAAAEPRRYGADAASRAGSDRGSGRASRCSQAQPAQRPSEAGHQTAPAEQAAPAAAAGASEEAGGELVSRPRPKVAAPAGAAAAGAAGGVAALLAHADPDAGAKDARKCAACHSFDEGGPAKIGPPLWGVIGRDIASVEGFTYSEALAGKEGAWDYQNLDAFLDRAEELGAGHQDGLRRDQEARGARRRDPLPALALERAGAAAVTGARARGAPHMTGGGDRPGTRRVRPAPGGRGRRGGAQVLPGATHGREQGRRQPGDGRRSRGRAGPACADPRDLSGARHRRRGVRRRAPGCRVRLAARSDRWHQVVRDRPSAVRHADRADPGGPPHPRRDRPVHPGRALARGRRSGQHLERPADPRARLSRARAGGAVASPRRRCSALRNGPPSPASRARCAFRSTAATATPMACWRWARST